MFHIKKIRFVRMAQLWFYVQHLRRVRTTLEVYYLGFCTDKCIFMLLPE